jgi:hypothetical protein
LAGLVRVRPTLSPAVPHDGAFVLSGRLSSARSAHAAASVNDTLVVAGGYQGATVATATTERGDGMAFGAGDAMPFATASATFGAGNVFVVAGGVPSLPMGPTDALSTCALWDGAFRTCAPLANGPVYGGASVFGSGALFVLGGALHGGDEVLTTHAVVRYEPELDAWRAEAHLALPRILGAAMEHAGVIYLVGGTTDDGTGMSRLAPDVVRYDLVERRFLGTADGAPPLPLPTPRAALSCVSWDGHGYCVGGYDAAGTNVAAVERLNFADGTWTSLPDLPEALSDGALVVHQGALFYLGGLTPSFSDSDRVYVLR